jgi:hypothetical protein
MRKESCALVYLIIPAYDLIIRNTKLFSTLNTRIFLLNSFALISSTLKLNFKKYAKQSENAQSSFLI